MIAGVAAGVPYVALPPAGGARPDAPVVVAWHLLDAPRTEAAFAAAVPLTGLDAWKIYFGLPMSGWVDRRAAAWLARSLSPGRLGARPALPETEALIAAHESGPTTPGGRA